MLARYLLYASVMTMKTASATSSVSTLRSSAWQRKNHNEECYILYIRIVKKGIPGSLSG